MKGWKTITLAILVAVVGLVQQLTDVIPDNVSGVVLMILGVVIGILRSITTTPIGRK